MVADQGAQDESGGRIGRPTLIVVVAVVAVVLAAMFGIRQTMEPTAAPVPEPDGSTTQTGSVDLELAVWGTEEEIAAYQAVVDDYNASASQVEVSLLSFDDSASLTTALQNDSIDPDLYLLPRAELAETLENERNVPLLDLLDARGLAFGEDYSRDSVAAFSVDDNLQCMPYGTAPMVMYYNTDLVDFDTMAERGLPVPNDERTAWSMEAFAAAADFASKPRRGTRGVYIEPTLEGLAPFVLSGGGSMFDDAVAPTSLALSEEDSASALLETIEVLRDPNLTLSSQQMERKSGLEWFTEGKVGMIAGYRDLTPMLRQVPGLKFDVITMPNLDSAATVGELSGLCLGAGKDDVGAAADFLIYMVSDEAVSRVSEVGYLQPTNVEVSFSGAFLQPSRLPTHATVFNEAEDDIVMMPLIDDLDTLQTAVGPQVEELLTVPVLDDVAAMLAAIDEASRDVLDADEAVPTDPPSDLESGGPEDTGGGDREDEAGAQGR